MNYSKKLPQDFQISIILMTKFITNDIYSIHLKTAYFCSVSNVAISEES